MRRFLLPAAASCMLVACMGLASAQERRERPEEGGREGAQQRAPDASRVAPSEPKPQPSRQTNQVQRGAEREQQGTPDRPARQGKGEGERDRAAQGEHQRDAGREPQSAPEQRARKGKGEANRDRAAQKEQSDQRRAAERDRDAAKRRADEHTQNGSTKRADRRELEQKRAAERAKPNDHDREAEREKQADEQQGRVPAQADPRRQKTDTKATTARSHELRQARDRLAPEQRQRLRTSFDFKRARANPSRVEARVAFRVPRSVRLYSVPTAVVTLFPDYRNYRYVVVDDQVCIVDPATYEVVDVIDRGYYAYAPSNSTAPGLSLTSEQIALVRDSIPRDLPDTETQVRLDVGASIPARAELHTFSPRVLDRIPKLRDYRFLVIGEYLVIADTDDRKVELVLDRI